MGVVGDCCAGIFSPMIDLAECPALERVPGKVSGAWLLRGTRLPLSAVLENLKSGASIDEISDWFEVEKVIVEEVLEFLAQRSAVPV